MSLTTTPKKCIVECSSCRMERTWPQGFHGVFKGTDALRKWLSATWGWTFVGGDFCRDCSNGKPVGVVG